MKCSVYFQKYSDYSIKYFLEKYSKYLGSIQNIVFQILYS